ncbi:MAG: hypothetical protein WB801_05575 [Candidatus Dormiibacterota bacterium]
MSQWPAAFGRFWYEFLVGDTPELALGVALIVGASWALSRVVGAAPFWFGPAAVVALLAVSLRRGTSRRRG